MHSTTISAASFLALVSAVAAQTAGFDAITTPAKDEVVPACSSYVINWEYVSTYAGTVSIQLLEGATPTTLQLGPVIASGVDNSAGQYTWAVDCGLGADATYGIKITYDGDATGATFQYSNPFAISAAAAASSAPAAATSDAPVTTAPANVAPVESIVYSTEMITITSCAATVTDCPARSTVTSSTVKPVVTGGAAAPSSAYDSSPIGGSPVASSFSSAAPVPAVTGAPSYPAGNSTTGGGAPGVAGGMGTVTLSTKTTTGAGSAATGSGAAATTAPITTAGAGRVAVGGIAALAGVVAAVFAL